MSSWSLVCAGLAAAVGWLMSSGPAYSALGRRAVVSRPSDAVLALVLSAVALVGLVALVGVVDTRIGVVAVAGTVIAPVASRLASGVLHRRDRHQTQASVVDLCDALAAELHAGLATQPALELACGEGSRWAMIAATGRFGGDVPTALRAAAQRPGAAGLRAVAAAWDVSARSGAGLAEVLDKVASALRDELDARAEISASVAPARTTAKMLAALPVFGLALGASMGAHPLDFLLSTSLGVACLAAGLLLALVGVLWVERLVDAAES
jgi:tight adherence protein B